MRDSDSDRLQSKTAGATVIDLDAYRQQSAIGSAATVSSAYVPPRAWTLILIVLAIFLCFFLFKR